MNATDDPPRSPFERSPAKVFYDEIERAFIGWRVTPLMFATDDWLVSKAWFEAGIPLELILETLQAAVERQQEKAQEVKRRLRYYDRLIQRTWRERQVLLAPATQPESPKLDIGQRLERLRRALIARGPFQIIALKLEALRGAADEVEGQLEILDRELLDLADQALAAEEKQALSEELERALGHLAARLPAATLEESRASIRFQLLRRAFRLPVLSLFDPVAEDS